MLSWLQCELFWQIHDCSGDFPVKSEQVRKLFFLSPISDVLLEKYRELFFRTCFYCAVVVFS